MPIEIKATAGGAIYPSPMIGPVNHTLHKVIDLSLLTISEVDADGYLKPGCVFKEAGNLLVPVGAAAGAIFVVHEAVKLALVTVPPTNATLATETGDHLIAVATHGLVNRDLAEGNKGIAYTANELTSFATAGTHLALTTT